MQKSWAVVKDYLYNGKELNEDFGLNWLDYGARWYDPVIGRFPSIDRFAEKYSSMTPYQYGANNPILNIDVNGDSIDVSNMVLNKHNKGWRKPTVNQQGIQTLANTMLELQEITGMELTFKNGQLIEGEGTAGRDDLEGSSGARNHLRSLISHKDNLFVYGKNGMQTKALTDKDGNVVNAFNINSDEAELKSSLVRNEGYNGLAWGLGTSFLHESLHTPMGAGLVGGTVKEHMHKIGSRERGKVVDQVNVWRKQAGLPIRLDYSPRTRTIPRIEFQDRNGNIFHIRAKHLKY